MKIGRNGQFDMLKKIGYAGEAGVNRNAFLHQPYRVNNDFFELMEVDDIVVAYEIFLSFHHAEPNFVTLWLSVVKSVKIAPVTLGSCSTWLEQLINMFNHYG